MEPATTIVWRLGGPSAVARVVGVHRTRVSNWQRPRLAGGTGGTIPQRYHRTLLDFAREQNIPLSAEDFLPQETFRPRQRRRAGLTHDSGE